MLNINHPIIFLDVDGVLNSVQFMKTAKAHHKDMMRFRLDPLCVDRLQRLIDKTDAVVVVSSTWRKTEEDMFDLLTFFSDYAIPIIGMTPGSRDGIRHKEITSWLKSHYVAHQCYVALDDDSFDMKDLKDHYVHTDGQVGLTTENVDQCLEVISKYLGTLEASSKMSTLERIHMLKQKLPKV